MSIHLFSLSLVFMLCLQVQSEVIQIPNGCDCSDFTWFRRGGFSGDCRAVDRDGLRFCYVHQPSTCRDLLPSLEFPNMQVSKQACRCRRDPHGFCDGANNNIFRGSQSLLSEDQIQGIVEHGSFLDPASGEVVLVVQDHEI